MKSDDNHGGIDWEAWRRFGERMKEFEINLPEDFLRRLDNAIHDRPDDENAPAYPRSNAAGIMLRFIRYAENATDLDEVREKARETRLLLANMERAELEAGINLIENHGNLSAVIGLIHSALKQGETEGW